MENRVLLERKGPILVITNNNPGARNALSFEYSDGAVAAIEEAGRDPSISAVVLTGAEGFFCAGGDLNILIKRREMAVPDRIEAINVLHGLIRAITACPKPVIAAVEGGAAGAGASIALACDLVVAADDAYFAVSYLRVGLTPDGGATSFLSAALPRQMVNEIIMFGDKVEASRLYSLGAVNRLVSRGSALDTAQELGERLHKMGPAVLAKTKRLIQKAAENTLPEQLDAEAVAMAEAQGGQESGEGISAFLEKRKADFTKFRV